MAGLALLGVAACSSTPEAATDDRRSEVPPGATRAWAVVPETVERGTSVEGRPIEARILGEGPEAVLIIGVIHGNEPVGQGLIARVVEELRLDRELLAGRRVIAVPVANPDGLARRSRRNARGVDLNRNFAASNFAPSPDRGPAPLSEPEAAFLADLITRHRPARIVSIHQPLGCVNYDGPAEDIARKMSEASGYPLEASIGYPTPGSLGSWAGIDLKIPIVTLEHARSADVPVAWTRHREALLIAVRGA